MLDDLRLIHERDAQDALGIAEKQWQQLEYDFNLPKLNFGAVDIENIVVAGMGGSALGALLSQTWPGHKIPFEICRNYNIPLFVSDKTLFIASSYSGNTEETLAALTQAEAAKARIVVIASGGKLAEIAKIKNYPIALLPSVTQPRYATLYSFKALLSWLMNLDILDTKTTEEEKKNEPIEKKEQPTNITNSVPLAPVSAQDEMESELTEMKNQFKHPSTTPS